MIVIEVIDPEIEDRSSASGRIVAPLDGKAARVEPVACRGDVIVDAAIFSVKSTSAIEIVFPPTVKGARYIDDLVLRAFDIEVVSQRRDDICEDWVIYFFVDGVKVGAITRRVHKIIRNLRTFVVNLQVIVSVVPGGALSREVEGRSEDVSGQRGRHRNSTTRLPTTSVNGHVHGVLGAIVTRVRASSRAVHPISIEGFRD